jgi:hypothetical protein
MYLVKTFNQLLRSEAASREILKMLRLKTVINIGALRLIFAACSLVLFQQSTRAEAPPVGGPDSIVIYNEALQPVQRLANLPPFTTCTKGPGTAFALGSPLLQSLVLVNNSGNPEKRIDLYGPPQRISAHSDGYLVVTHRGTAADVSLEGTIRRELGGARIVNAVALPGKQGFVVVRTSGEVELISWEGKVAARYASDTAGRPVSIKDIAIDGQNSVVALDAGTNELITLDEALRETRRTPLTFAVKDITSIQAGYPLVVALYADKSLIRTVSSDGTSTLYRTDAPITCALGLQNKTIALGTTSSNVVYIPYGANAALDTELPALTGTSLFAIICYALIGAFGLVFCVKRWSPRQHRWGPLNPPLSGDVSGGGDPPLTAVRHVSWALCLFSIFAAIGGLVLSWHSYPELRATGSLNSWGKYWLGALISATALFLLGRKAALYKGLVAPTVPATFKARGSISWVLVSLSLCSVAVIHYLIPNHMEPAWIISTWIAGQVFILCAFSRPDRRIRWTPGEWAGVAILLAATVATRVYKWTECPPNIHFDFGSTAEEAVMILLKDWYPLFELRAGQTIGRAWLVQMAGGIWLFGLHEWVIRLPSLVWSVGLTLSCYLLGRQTFSHRFGLIFGGLVIAQHNLLAYSRLPYVTESTAPFIFCLYFLSRGIHTNALRDWAFAGAWAGWSMMTVRTFTTFPAIGAALFLFFCIFHLRAIWRNIANILVMTVSMVVVFSPHYYFYAASEHLSYRLGGVSPLMPNYKLSTDLSLWMAQMGAAFGAILRLPDRPPWPSESLDPICMAITGSLFGAGLLFLLAKRRSTATPIALIAMVGSIGLGSGFLTNPPSYYHHFVGIVFVMFIVAVPLECLLQAVGTVRNRALSGIFAVMLVGACGLAVYEQVRPFLSFCAFAFDDKGDAASPHNVYSLLSKHLLSHRTNRFVMLADPQKGPEIHHSNCSIFYGQFSERHEITTPIRNYLPMRPTPQRQAVEFMTLFRIEELEEVKKMYPGGVEATLFFDSGRGKISSYTVGPEQIKSVYENSLSTGALLDKDYYSLRPVS